MYTFHDLFTEDDIKVMSKAFLELSEDSLFLDDLFKDLESRKKKKKLICRLFLSLHTYLLGHSFSRCSGFRSEKNRSIPLKNSHLAGRRQSTNKKTNT